MLPKWVKILFLVCLAVGTIILFLLYLDVTSAAFSIGFNFVLMFWFTILESQINPSLKSAYFAPFPLEKQ